MNEFQLVLGNLFLVFLLKAMCFVLGYLIVRLGHDLLEKGVKGEFKFKASFSGTKADLASASPGLLFVLLGVCLIGYAMQVSKVMEIKETQTTSAPPKVTLPPIK